jgi:hypothetical protein
VDINTVTLQDDFNRGETYSITVRNTIFVHGLWAHEFGEGLVCQEDARECTSHVQRTMFVLYCYGSVWQPMFDDMQQNVKSICFHEGLSTKAELLDIHRDNKHLICVVDDLMS